MVPLHWVAQNVFVGTQQEKIQYLLQGIDVLQRYKKTPLENLDLAFEVFPENARVAAGQNNVYGTEISALEQDIQTILSARRQIVIDDQFLFDPQIFEALRVARKHHGVDIFVMLHPLTSPGKKEPVGAHIPNNLFVPELISMGANCLLYTSPSPRDGLLSRMPSSA